MARHPICAYFIRNRLYIIMYNYDIKCMRAGGDVAGMARGLARIFMVASLVAVCLLVAALFAGCVTDAAPEPPRSLGAGDRCPYFEVVLDDGRAVSTSSLAGRRVMIVFFNTSCADCRRELPEIQRVADGLGDDGSGVPRVLCVSRGEGAGSVAAYWRDNGLTMPYSAQTDAAVYREFATSVIPRVYIIGADLVIEAAYA